MWFWFESGCWFFPCLCTFLKPVLLNLSFLGLLWLYFLNVWFLVTETWGSQNYQPVLWKPSVVLLNIIFCQEVCGFLSLHSVWKEAPFMVPPRPCESLALPFKFIILPISLSSLPGTTEHLLLFWSTCMTSFARFDFGYLVLWDLVKGFFN